VNSTVQEAEFAENGTRMIELFAGRSPLTGELLSDARRRVADITFDREYTLDLGGVTVRMLVVGPTHTAGDTGFFVEGDRVLFAGDVVMNESFVAANQGSSVRAWLAAFDAFEAMGPTTIVPAHGAIGDGALIPTLRTIVEEIRQRALALKAQGRSADQAADAIQAELVARHPGWPRANGIASLARAAWNEGP
jgi:glyoxylase-like metal-dependent hydrolase (beta-lactamase superfamily II)